MLISDWSSDVCSSDLAIAQRQEAIAEEMDDETIDEDAYTALDQEYDALSEEEHALHNIPPVLPDEIKPLVGAFLKLTPRGEVRSEEHTSGLQPLMRISYAVFCLNTKT